MLANRLRYSGVLVLLLVVACLFAGGAASSQSTVQEQYEPVQDAWSPDSISEVPLDAKLYAKDYGVSLEEAAFRMDLQERFADELAYLEAELREKEPDTFAGLWIQHEYRFVVSFTGNGEETIRPYIEGESMAEYIEAKSGVDATLLELKGALNRAKNLVNLLGVPAESGIDVFNNRAYLNVIDRGLFNTVLQEGGLQLPDNVTIVKADEFLKSSANIYAGLKLIPPSRRFCTSGFSVRNTVNGRAGTTTAGHCFDENSNRASYRGTRLYYQRGAQRGPYDLQWHTSANIERPWARYPGGRRVITGARGRIDQPLNSYVCHFGQGGAAPEYKCGRIRDRVFGGLADHPNPTNTYILVENYNTDLDDIGDSGGPWYTRNGRIALGIHVAGDRLHRAAYMSITYFDDSGPIDFNLEVMKAD